MTADPRDLGHLKVLCPDSQMRSPSPSFTASGHLSVFADNISSREPIRFHFLLLQLRQFKVRDSLGRKAESKQENMSRYKISEGHPCERDTGIISHRGSDLMSLALHSARNREQTCVFLQVRA